MNKQHILDEIKRTAKENGGSPLGVRKFETETGIKQSDWRGKYWARWSDAVNEVGLLPNLLQSAYDDAHLLGKYTELIRELGRFPTTSEIQLKRRRDATFPSQTVFERFGSKAAQAKKIVEYCAGLQGLEDVAAICAPLVRDEPQSTETDGGLEVGYVYLALMKVGREKRYKIGKANLVDQRTRQVAVNLPEELELIHVISTDDAYGIEGYWHKRFAEKRRGGEWFALTAEDVRVFKRRKFM
jgi:hypothetical protein